MAAADEVRDGFAEHAIVPDAAVPLTPARLRRLVPSLAGADTPPGLCLGFGRLRDCEGVVAAAAAEARQANFVPHQGSSYRLGLHRARLVDVLRARPGTRTTTVMDPRITQYSESGPARWVGLHYDNTLTEAGEGERYPRGIRVESSEQRVLHNMGPGSRAVVVALNMSALHLSDRVRHGDSGNIPTTAQLREFLVGHPSEVSRIVCLVWTIEVGDLVVLPAGTALHDGSMVGLRMPSNALVFAGQFPRGAFG
ncbi:hypothetical protein ABZ312_12050 [Streptomyces sp. NPDC006207]